MPTYLIERDIPDAGSLSSGELRDIAAKSNEVLATMAPRARWLQSYVTDDRLYCVYDADDDTAIREHARRGGFPANRIASVVRMIDPTTAAAAIGPTAVPGGPVARRRMLTGRQRLAAAAGALALAAGTFAAVVMSGGDDPAPVTTAPAAVLEQPGAFDRAVSEAVRAQTITGPQRADGHVPSAAATPGDELVWLP